MPRIIFHIDVNSAYLSWSAVEQLKNGAETDLRKIPAIIGGDRASRHGVVLAKSISAKKYGIRTGEPVVDAIRKCPNLVIAPPDHRLYSDYSRKLMTFLRGYTDQIEQVSVDECYMDFTEIAPRFSSPMEGALEIKNEVRRQFGFTVNVGISENKLLAKMASDFEKPDKVHTLFPAEIPEKLWPLPVRDLLFLGKASEQRLLQEGIKTIGDMARSGEAEIKRILGEKTGHQLYRYANGIDDSPVRAEREEAKGYSAETTVEEDLVTYEQALALLLAQCDVVAARMRRDGKKCSCVAVTYRTLDFKTRSHQRAFEDPTDVTEEIFAQVKKLLYECWKCEPLRLIGMALTDLTTDDFRQISLFENPKEREKQKKADEAFDDIRRRFGNGMIVRGSTMSTAGKVARKAKAQMDQDVRIKKEKEK